MALTSEKPWRATKKSNFCQYYKTYSRTALLAKIENIYRIEIGCFIQFYAILFVTEINKWTISYGFKRIQWANHIYVGHSDWGAAR